MFVCLILIPQRWAGCDSPWGSAQRGSSSCSPCLRRPEEPRWYKATHPLSWTPEQQVERTVRLSAMHLYNKHVMTKPFNLDHGSLKRTVRNPRSVHHPSCQVSHALHYKGIESHHGELLLQQQGSQAHLVYLWPDRGNSHCWRSDHTWIIPNSARLLLNCFLVAAYSEHNSREKDGSECTTKTVSKIHMFGLKKGCFSFTDQFLNHSRCTAAHTEPPRVQDVHGNLSNLTGKRKQIKSQQRL